MDDWRVLVGVAVIIWGVWTFWRSHEQDQARRYALAAQKVAAQRDVDVAKAESVNRSPTPALQTLNYGPHTQVQQLPAPERAALADPVVAESAAPALPPVPSFAVLLSQGIIGPGRPLITGYSEGLPMTGALADWRSGAIAGLPGSGKTTTQRFIAAQAALQGARLVILDPHMYKGDDSLAGTLAPLAPSFLCPPAERPREMLRALRLVTDILQGRLAGKPVDFPLFVFVDEFTALMARSDLAEPLAVLLEMIAQEGRASLCQAAISGQIWTAARAGGSALRDSLASTYVHRMKPGQARVLLPAEDAQRASRLPTGAAVLWRADGTIADVVIPLTTAADMVTTGRLLTASHGASQVIDAASWSPSPAVKCEVQSEGECNFSEAPEKGGEGLSARAQLVRELVRAGTPSSQIIKQVWGVEGGKGYQAAAQELTGILAQLVP